MASFCCDHCRTIVPSRFDKGYSDKAIQTEPAVWQHPSDSYNQKLASVPAESFQNPFTLVTLHSKESSITNEVAYTHPPVVQLASPPTLRYMHKYPQLIYNRPNLLGKNLSDKRIASLPNTLSSSNRVSYDGITMRVVSLPERPIKCLPKMTDHGSEGSEASTETSYSPSRSLNRRIHAYPHSDLPQTPSPPSSPSSVLTTDHDPGYLPKPSPLQEGGVHYGDDGGWITWTSSPPRPIPALHGPLSLPYARCPSGAEGTLIGGNTDLPHMIWGLGSDDIQPTYASYHSNTAMPNKTQPQSTDISPSLQKPNVQVPICLDNQSPSLYNRDTCYYLPGKRQELSTKIPQHFNPYQTILGGQQNSPIHVIDSPPTDRIHAYGLRGDLLRDTQRDTHVQYKTSRLLNSSTPFVQPKQKMGSYPRIFVGPHAASENTSPYEKSTTELYNFDQHTLPTPPNSSAPQWSSMFHQHPPSNPIFLVYSYLNNKQRVLEDDYPVPGAYLYNTNSMHHGAVEDQHQLQQLSIRPQVVTLEQIEPQRLSHATTSESANATSFHHTIQKRKTLNPAMIPNNINLKPKIMTHNESSQNMSKIGNAIDAKKTTPFKSNNLVKKHMDRSNIQKKDKKRQGKDSKNTSEKTKTLSKTKTATSGPLN